MAPANLHIVMLPYMAQGHLIPFISLAKLITNRYPTFTITIASTPLNVDKLNPLLSSTSNIRTRVLPFDSAQHNLPPNTENSDCLPSHHLIIRLMESSQSLEPHFKQLISDILAEEDYKGNPVCIISDVFFGWSVGVAAELGIFHATFTTCGGYGTPAYMSLWLHLPHTSTDADEFSVPGFPEDFRLQRSQLSPYMRAADANWCRFLRKQITYSFRSRAMLCNTVKEVESFGIEILEKLGGVKVFPVGPLLPLDPKSAYERTGKKPGIGPEECAKWLDLHSPGSVLYISFGSQNNVAKKQMMELAAGVEASQRPFVWAIRPPLGVDVNGEIREEWLPEGFERRVKEMNRGLLIRGWAPQLEILSHRSVGAFLSHCGWNSVLESLSRGVPVIAWPLASEQFYNSKMMEEELGVCVELGRGVNGEVGRGEVEKVVKMVMGGEKGVEMKAKAVECSKKMRAAMSEGEVKGSSIMALDEFVRAAVSNSRRCERAQVAEY